MTERVIMRLWVYGCPVDQRAAALAALGELGREWSTGRPGPELDLSRAYQDDAFHAGDTCAAEGLARALAGAAPGVSFLMKVTPDQCNPGIIRACTPALGHYVGEINSDGEVVLPADRIEQLIAPDPGGDRPATIRKVRNSLREAYGQPWLADFWTQWRQGL